MGVREEFYKVGVRERGRDGLVLDVDFTDLNIVLDDFIPNLVLRVSRDLANGLRSGDSAWPVLTGYSRSRFEGSDRGIHNDASYASVVERRTGAAVRYVRNDLQESVDAVTSENFPE